MTIRIIDLAVRPDLRGEVEGMMRAEWPDWYGEHGPGDAGADLRSARADALPCRLAAIVDDAPVATAGLLPASIASHRHLTPWLGGLVTAPGWRRRGCGAALVAAVEARARKLGVARLHAATATAGALLERRGWSRFETLPDGLTLYHLRLAPVTQTTS